MAYLEYSSPTSWSDAGMDWDNPDMTNRVYLDALVLAVRERITQLAGTDVKARAFPKELSPEMVYGVDSMKILVSLIIGIMKVYVVENPDEGSRITTPFISVYESVASDTLLEYLCVGTGMLLQDDRSTMFLKSCRHFVDLCTIVPITPMLKADVWDENNFSESYDSWEEAWIGYFLDEDLEIVADQIVDHFYASFNNLITVGNSRFKFNSNLRYLPYSALAHKLLVQFRSDYDPNEFQPYYGRAWDYTNSDFSMTGLVNHIAVSASSGVVQIGGTEPISPSSFVAWDTEETGVPYNGNTKYFCQSVGFWVDFGVYGGFQFRGSIP